MSVMTSQQWLDKFNAVTGKLTLGETRLLARIAAIGPVCLADDGNRTWKQALTLRDMGLIHLSNCGWVTTANSRYPF